MAALSHDCPHCGVMKSYFTVNAGTQNPKTGHWSAYATCGGCFRPIAIEIASPGGYDPLRHQGFLQGSQFLVMGVYPASAKPEVPEHLHPDVAGPFMQACEARIRKHFDAAGAMYRKALDVATRKIDPSLKGLLAARIDQLAKNNLITPSLKEWAHTVRIDGNDATHDEDPFTEPEADSLHFFTELLLIYLFTLPEQVKLRSSPKITPGAAA